MFLGFSCNKEKNLIKYYRKQKAPKVLDMYICTDTIEDILLSISAMLSCSQQQIEVFSRNLYCGCEENSTIYMDRIRNKVNDFITTHAIAEVDMVCMHHLTRRLNGFPEEEGEGKNLHDLLLSESALTKFLASYHINFTSSYFIIFM